MSARVKAVIAVLIGVALMETLVYCFRFQEPSFEGRSLTSWIGDLRPGRSNRIKAEAAIRSIGSNGVPAIRRMLQRRDGPVRTQIVAWLGPQRAAKLKLEPEYFYNWNGIAAARVLGPVAAPVAADVVQFLTNSDMSHRINSANALWSIGPGARGVVPQMVAALGDKNSQIRPEILDGIAFIGGDPNTINPKLMPLLSDPEEQTRGRAVACVLALSTNVDEIATVGINALHDKSVYVRSCALVGLTKHGTNAAKVLPATVALLDDNDPSIRRLAASCRDAIAPKSASLAGSAVERAVIELNFQGVPTSGFIGEYESLRGQRVETASNVRTRILRLKTAAPITKTEALAMLNRCFGIRDTWLSSPMGLANCWLHLRIPCQS